MNKFRLTWLIALLFISARAETTQPLGDWGEITLPETYQTGVAFPVKVTVSKLDKASKLVITANWMKPNKQFGGFLQLLGVNREISEPGTYTFNVTISKTRPDMGQTSLSVYLSPDGSWQNRTAAGAADISGSAASAAAAPAAPAAAIATVSKPLDDWAVLTVPKTYKTGIAFPVTLEILKLDAPGRLVLNAGWLKQNGQYGGFLQMLGAEKDVSQPGTFHFNVTVTKTKPGMKAAVLNAYLSPDGNWQNKTRSGTADIPLDAGGASADIDYTALTQEAKPFRSETAPLIPSLKEGGFAENPSFEDGFDPGWPEQKKLWQVASWKQNGAMMSPERCKVDNNRYLVQTVKAGEPFLGGSVQSRKEFGWGRWVARVKPSAVPGVLNSIFTKDWDDLKTASPDNDGNGGEIDIELLTYTFGENRGKVHLAIHLKDRPNFYSVNPELDFNPSDDFHEWGFDILPDRVVWHIDGRVLDEWLYKPGARIDENYEFFFNSWTMKKWINGPPQEDAHYLVDWVRFYPYTKANP
jgi:hypothetical protein